MPAVRAFPAAGGRVPARRRPTPLVEVWRVRLDVADAGLARAADLLTADELDHADRGSAVVRRRRVVLRAGLRTVLGAALGCSPADVPLGRSAQGRPRVELPGALWDVSCAGSDELGLVAVARGASVGIDVERTAPWTDDVLAEGWLSPAEATALVALPPAERAGAATRCWTRKEAVLKAVGSGLTVPPAATAVGGDGGAWALADVVVPRGFSATLASSSRVWPRNSTILPRLLPDPTP